MTTPVRDQADTGFSRHLDALIRQVPEALCAVFVDGEGEAVDIATRMDTFEARVAGAEMAIVLFRVREGRARLGQGAFLELRIEGAVRSMIVRTVSEGYDLVVLVNGAAISGRTAEMTAATAVALLVESGLPPPPSYAVLRSNEQRPSRAGILVPTAFEERGVRRHVEAILGQRAEDDGSAHFLIRLEDGEELIVAWDRTTNRWLRA